jgi:hypothetical protein
VGEGQDFAGHPSRTHVSVQQAAEHLGTTVDAIRKRVQRDTIAFEKDPERQAHSEARRLLAAALERIPAIEAPSEERERRETPDHEPESTDSRTEQAEPQRSAERSWWRRMFGG